MSALARTQDQERNNGKARLESHEIQGAISSPAGARQQTYHSSRCQQELFSRQLALFIYGHVYRRVSQRLDEIPCDTRGVRKTSGEIVVFCRRFPSSNRFHFDIAFRALSLSRGVSARIRTTVRTTRNYWPRSLGPSLSFGWALEF